MPTAADPAPRASTDVLSTASSQALELPAVLAVVAEFCATDVGRSRVLTLEPTADPVALEERLERLREIGVALEDARPVPSLDEPVSTLVDAALGPSGLDGRQWVRLGRVLGVVRRALDRFLSDPEPWPRLARLAAGLEPSHGIAELVREIERMFDSAGELRDEASPRLASLRARQRQQRDQLYRRLGDYVERHRQELAEETVSLRDGRLVVLLPAGSRGRLPGLVQGRSSSGRSFYFEPLELVEANNDLQQVAAEEVEERRRLLEQLSRRTREQRPAIVAHAEVLAELDLLCASHDFGVTAKAHPLLPGKGDPRLRSARHPLLEPALAGVRARALGHPGHRAEVVPLDLDLDAARRLLVVTGPNAGGKTVALKTLGLAAAMAQCGLPVAAEPGSTLPRFERIVAVVGDEQDLLSDRSTFSGRLLRLSEAWRDSGPRALILLDELGSGTGPEEGTALSISLLEELVERQAWGVLVTHLTPLAATALELEGAGCAAMEFDPHSRTPTFRMRPGPPAASEAIALGHRLGLPERWLERAEQLLGSEQRELRHLLRELEASRDELRRRQAELEVELDDQRKLRQRLATELEEASEERRGLKQRYRDELERFRRQVRDQLATESERLRERLQAGRRRGLAAEATERLFREAPRELLEPERPTATEGEPGEVDVGDRVRHLGFGWQGLLESLDGRRATVRVGGKTLRCGRDELVRVEEQEHEPRRSRVEVAVASSGSEGGELNLIGQRVETALDLLDQRLDRALLEDEKMLRVVHGHGSGALRRAVREHLASHPAVASHAPAARERGGDGATEVRLRG